MPRHIRATAKEVQKARGAWWSFHYENRQKAKALNAYELHSYQHCTSLIGQPRMTVFGGLEGDFPERRAYQIAAQSNLDVNLINPWYVSEEGWQTFLALWHELPEPVDIFSTPPCVQIGELYTLYTVPAEAEPPK